jgi:hypothetical protein
MKSALPRFSCSVKLEKSSCADRTRAPFVVSRLVGHQGSDELRERLPDPLFGHPTIAKGAREELGIRPVARDRVDDARQVLSHLDPALDGQQHHLFQLGRPFVPEEPRPVNVRYYQREKREAIVNPVG